MPYGIQDRILRVNLSTGAVSCESPGELFYRKYIGGRGLVAYYLWHEVPPQADPLGPENKLIFAVGPLTGTSFLGSGRNSVGAKSPLTGAYSDAEAGGFWGAELKRAGYDALIIEGQSDKPVYLWIKDDQVEIRDAAHLWGQKTAPVEKQIQKELGDERIRVAQIGPGGENGVAFANICNDLTHFYGRGGLGAVMGSKKLRAIAIRGQRPPVIAHPERLQALVRWYAENWESMNKSSYEYGTTSVVMSLNASGGLPTRNFQEGSFEGAANISHTAINEKYLIDREGCWACPIRCKRVVQAHERYNVDPIYGGPEYETLASLGSCCGIDDLEAVMKGNELCAAYALDTISTGVTIAWAMEAYTRGILTAEELDGLELNFGNGAGLVALIEKIAYREGVGDLLAQGSKKAALQVGKNSIEFAMEGKGQEIPMHEPRLKSALSIGYAVSPTGADHCHAFHDTTLVSEGPFLENMRAIGVRQPLPLSDLSSDKVYNTKQITNWRYFSNMAEICNFMSWTPVQLEEALRAVTGWNISIHEIMDATERVATLCRLFNLREGFTARDDYLKKRFFEPLASLNGHALDKETFDSALTTYYEMMGWSAEGVPTFGTLARLGLDKLPGAVHV
ncbi:MAG: aldehyde ferredoxin oxidoreductase family protein [Symbiobacteriaceae bacterium]|nr:aldehyde ferredoxin oxidoreductase family protein [Symbiobacteriaceae bacterium]